MNKGGTLLPWNEWLVATRVIRSARGVEKLQNRWLAEAGWNAGAKEGDGPVGES